MRMCQLTRIDSILLFAFRYQTNIMSQWWIFRIFGIYFDIHCFCLFYFCENRWIPVNTKIEYMWMIWFVSFRNKLDFFPFFMKIQLKKNHVEYKVCSASWVHELKQSTYSPNKSQQHFKLGIVRCPKSDGTLSDSVKTWQHVFAWM